MNISLLYNVFMGETSPLIAARIDSPVNEMGARHMENMIPMMTGGLRKRPGTLFVGNTDRDANTGEYKEARLIEWLLSDGSCLILEMTKGAISVWRGNTVIQALPSPYTAEQVKKLHYAASADELWIVHRDHRPMILKWNGNKVEEPIERLFPNFTNGEGERDFITKNNNPSCVAFDSGRLCFAGSNNEPNRIYLSRAPDSLTGKNRHTDFTTADYPYDKLDADGNPERKGVVDGDGNPVKGPLKKLFSWNGDTLIYKDISYKVKSTPTSEGLRIDLYTEFYVRHEPDEPWRDILADPVGSIWLDSQYKVLEEKASGVAADMKDLLDTFYDPAANTGIWYYYEQLTEPVYDTERPVITASHAIVLEENDMHGSRLQWIAGNQRLLAATSRATWNDTGEVPTPMTFDMNIIEYVGSNDLQARGTKEIMVYAGRDGKSLRALVWNQSAQGSGYIDMDIGERAAHLFGAGIKDFAVADYPYPMIWIVTNAGELISCTIDIRGGILAYARHPTTDGLVEAIAIARQTTGDEIFLVVKRGDTRNIERLILEDLVNADFTDSHYVDAGETRTFSTPKKTIDGLQRFAGKTIHIFADGAIEPPVKVSEGGIAELQHAVSKVHLGLPYMAAFSPNERQIPANGTSLGKKRRIEKITLRLYKSLGGKAGTAEDKTTPIITKRLGEYKLGEAPEPFTGEIDVAVSGNIDTEGKLVITHEEPTPFTLLALVERVAILET